MEIFIDVAQVGERNEAEVTTITFKAVHERDEAIFQEMTQWDWLDVNGQKFLPRHKVQPEESSRQLFFISPVMTNQRY